MERSTWLTILIIILMVSVALVAIRFIVGAFAFIFQYAGIIAIACLIAIIILWNWRR